MGVAFRIVVPVLKVVVKRQVDKPFFGLFVERCTRAGHVGLLLLLGLLGLLIVYFLVAHYLERGYVAIFTDRNLERRSVFCVVGCLIFDFLLKRFWPSRDIAIQRFRAFLLHYFGCTVIVIFVGLFNTISLLFWHAILIPRVFRVKIVSPVRHRPLYFHLEKA